LCSPQFPRVHRTVITGLFSIWLVACSAIAVLVVIIFGVSKGTVNARVIVDSATAALSG
jgi:hypothetical protein